MMSMAKVFLRNWMLITATAMVPFAAGEEPANSDPATADLQAGEEQAFRDWLRSFSLATTDQVERRMTIDAMPGSPLLEWPEARGWNAWKERMSRDKGLRWSVDYVNAYMRATHSPGDKVASGGALRFFGAWQISGDSDGNSGALIWKIEQRHAYGSHVSPQGLAAEVGYAGLLHLTLSDQGGRLSNLYWRQRLRGGDLVLLGGWLDTSDYMDVYLLASPWTGFFNYVFSTGGASIPVPNEGLGVAAGGYFNENFYMVGGLVDANSDPHRPHEGFDTFFGDQEYFTHLDLGWNFSRDKAFLDNIHMTLWQVDERKAAAVKGGWGANMSWSTLIGRHWTTFLRAGYAEDGGSILEQTVSAGMSWSKVPAGNQLGVGLNWGVPMESTYGPGLPEQTTAEVFYRIQLFEDLALTPDLQYLRNPALYPEQDSLWVWGIRMRLAI